MTDHKFVHIVPDDPAPAGDLAPEQAPAPMPKRRFRLEDLTDAGLARLEWLLSEVGNNHADVVDRRRIRLRQAQRELGVFVQGVMRSRP
jgi:hypothetical protein